MLAESLASQNLTKEQILELVASISGDIVAVGVSADEYLEKYSAEFSEWVGGIVIKMPTNEVHDRLLRYLLALFGAYLELRPIGTIRQAPFVMQITPGSPHREPDLQIVFNEHLDRLKPTFTQGPADICIEIVSPESVDRDHGEKLSEYEKGGVPEYWIIDPIHTESRFFRLNEQGVYVRQSVDADGSYRTPALPGFVLDVLTLWQEKLPGPIAIGKSVEQMLSAE